MLLNVATVAAIMLLLIGVFITRRAHRRQATITVPTGDPIYEDTREWPGETLFSEQHGLNGKPDFLFEESGTIVPVEVKSGKTPTQPYWGHIMQLMAYCVLVEANYGVRPEYGIIRYPAGEFNIPFTPEREKVLMDILADMREKRGHENVARSHTNPRICASCGYNQHCDERIAS